ncbi:MAG: PTS sugar transporter subunit IIC [Eggerthellaceae bacterium]|nr:PTS sugar transporter subunit IIC [Eggerthellaceae bacterium]
MDSTDSTQQKQGVKGFLERKDIEISFQRYAIDALSAMAQGLFASLLIGTIFNTIGNLTGLAAFNDIGAFATAVAGPAMAVAIGYALKSPPLVLYSLVVVGYAANSAGGAGGPLAVLVVAIVAAELGKAVSKETRVDILVTPAVTVGLGCALAMAAGPAIGAVATAIGSFIMWATELQPFLMGILVSVVVGIALTLPISSAAICAALGLTGLAGGAALAGCCAQMVGFAVISFRDNGWGGVVSQGIGTSMLQMGNIMRKPAIWVPPIVASAICGPIATCVFAMQQNGPAIASGMGTCGLVGPIGLYSGWIADGIVPGPIEWLGMALVCVVLPALISWAVAFAMRKAGLIADGDMKLD